MARESRFTFVFSEDGSTMTYGAGAEPPRVLNFDKLASNVLRDIRNNGAKQALADTCANATKLGWSDAQCVAQMHRRVVAWVAGQYAIGSSESDFADMVAAAAKLYGKTEAECSVALSKKPDEWRRAFRAQHAVAIAEARLARLQAAVPAAPADVTSDLFDI